MFHSLFALWFRLTLEWGYWGVFTLMAIESTIFPLPSELVVPPAAYWAEQGRFHFWGVVAAATLGSWAGSAVSYWVARRVGRPLLLRYGKFVFVPESKWLLAERWINRYSASGIFFARLLEHGIVVSPGESFGAGGEGYFRLALVPTLEQIEQAIAVWERITW